MLLQGVRDFGSGGFGVGGRPGVERKLTGDEIRAKIEENRQKRLLIGNAMMREAGVRGQEINALDSDDSGLAWLNTGEIRSPEGRTIWKLHTIAHECGHIFLHGAGKPGYRLPSHVKEMEAESYAHQALAAYGMKSPKRWTDWGRQYVGTHVVKDRAAGIPIDPRVLAYVAGTRSPYEPLRDQPAAWTCGVESNQLAAHVLATIPAPNGVIDLATERERVRVAEAAERERKRLAELAEREHKRVAALAEAEARRVKALADAEARRIEALAAGERKRLAARSPVLVPTVPKTAASETMPTPLAQSRGPSLVQLAMATAVTVLWSPLVMLAFWLLVQQFDSGAAEAFIATLAAVLTIGLGKLATVWIDGKVRT
jgi:cell division septum initiation protein DivIVA